MAVMASESCGDKLYNLEYSRLINYEFRTVGNEQGEKCGGEDKLHGYTESQLRCFRNVNEWYAIRV